jgi:Flp pilus assembly protein TadG
LLNDSRGSTAVEFGIVAPALIMSILGIFWFGWSMHNASSLNFVLDQAGRALQLNPR